MDLSIPVAGMSQAQNIVDSSAHEISRASFDNSIDLAKEITNQIIGEGSYKANIQVAKTSDEMMGTLLDMVG